MPNAPLSQNLPVRLQKQIVVIPRSYAMRDLFFALSAAPERNRM
jgi:hypothetical protein